MGLVQNWLVVSGQVRFRSGPVTSGQGSGSGEVRGLGPRGTTGCKFPGVQVSGARSLRFWIPYILVSSDFAEYFRRSWIPRSRISGDLVCPKRAVPRAS